MANNIGWGQGAVNNTIGWGQGAINNLISWGKSHLSSYTDETNIVGDLVIAYTSSFRDRVIADAGTFEAYDCMISTLNNI